MLKGQKPAANTILMPLPEITQDKFAHWYKPAMTVPDSCFADPPDGRRISLDELSRYFTNGGTPSPALTPSSFRRAAHGGRARHSPTLCCRSSTRSGSG